MQSSRETRNHVIKSILKILIRRNPEKPAARKLIDPRLIGKVQGQAAIPFKTAASLIVHENSCDLSFLLRWTDVQEIIDYKADSLRLVAVNSVFRPAGIVTHDP
jgi:hypothetical protein